MMKNKFNLQDISLLYTIAIFGMSMMHIGFALLGLACYAGAVGFYLVKRDKTWCTKICPRASFLSKTLSKISLHKKMPKHLTHQNVKSFFVWYMGLNFFFATMSTIMVALGRMDGLLHVRLFMAFQAPFTLPQLLSISLPEFLTHFSYRIYSMTLSSTLIGLVLGVLYAPRTWCAVCPVNTLSVVKKHATS
jgi:hypothetical protein